MKDIKIKKISNGLWHSNIQVKYKDLCLFKLTDNFSGCGSMILSGYNINCERYIPKFKESLSKILELIKNNKGKDILEGDYNNNLDIGCIITTIGENHYKKQYLNILKELNFKELIQYNNPRHSGKKQSLYIWTIGNE